MLPALFASLALLMATAKKQKMPWKPGASSRQITNLKQYIFLSFYIYGFIRPAKVAARFIPHGMFMTL
jgi:hypothetical protein